MNIIIDKNEVEYPFGFMGNYNIVIIRNRLLTMRSIKRIVPVSETKYKINLPFHLWLNFKLEGVIS